MNNINPIVINFWIAGSAVGGIWGLQTACIGLAATTTITFILSFFNP